jgi:hypothetical protein
MHSPQPLAIPVVTPNTPVASCTVTAAAIWQQLDSHNLPGTDCDNQCADPANCTAAVASGGNKLDNDHLPGADNIGTKPVASCTAVAASAGNSYTAAMSLPCRHY